MMQLKSDICILRMDDDGMAVVLEDVRNKTRWQLDENTRLVAPDAQRFDQEIWTSESLSRKQSHVALLGPGKACYEGPDTILCTHNTSFGKLILRWVMKPDRLEIVAEPSEESSINAIALAGTFYPENKNAFSVLVPNCQGILHTGKGPAFYSPLWGTGSGGFAMAFFAQLFDRNALLSITETDTDTTLHWEKTDGGQIRIMWRQEPSLGKLRYSRKVTLFPCEADITKICKLYRKYEEEHDRITTWEEKISSRPKLAGLFGSAMIFTGYNCDKQLDYEAAFIKLKSAGIEKAFVYPVYYNQNLNDEANKKLTVPWADYRNLLGVLQKLGYMAGSFIYIMDSPTDNKSELRFNNKKEPVVYWEMEGLKWCSLANKKRIQLNREIIDGEHKQLDWIHYDTLTCGPLLEDYNPEHVADAAAERATRKQMLDYAAGKGLIVSSEGFWGRMTGSYDLGSTKYSYALGGDEYCIVPMTMLVYHDCAYHTWWEIDNYSNPEHLSQYGRGYLLKLPFGGGSPKRQAAMDALMGTLPDIFPFGMQWNFIPHSKNLYYYKPVFDDAIVQESINRAKPVMALNKKIGKLKMIEHRLHRSDGAIQETVFANGTRVIANFADVQLESSGVGLLEPQSWVSL